MDTKIRKLLSCALLAGLAALSLASPAGAQRGGTTTTTEPQYVPPIEDPYEDPFEDDASSESPFDDPVEDPLEDTETGGALIDDPAADPAGSGGTARPAPGDTPAGSGGTARPAPGDAPAIEPVNLPESASPGTEDHSRAGVLSNTGASTMTLVRAALAALALGGGLVAMGRRRRTI